MVLSVFGMQVDEATLRQLSDFSLTLSASFTYSRSRQSLKLREPLL
jgi:hypothetical protein